MEKRDFLGPKNLKSQKNVIPRQNHVFQQNRDFPPKSCFSSKTKKILFLGCSGPLNNARTIPEWLKKKLEKKIEKNY